MTYFHQPRNCVKKERKKVMLDKEEDIGHSERERNEDVVIGMIQ